MVNAMFVMKGWASTNDSVVRQAVEDLSVVKTNPFQMYPVKIGSAKSVNEE